MTSCLQQLGILFQTLLLRDRMGPARMTRLNCFKGGGKLTGDELLTAIYWVGPVRFDKNANWGFWILLNQFFFGVLVF